MPRLFLWATEETLVASDPTKGVRMLKGANDAAGFHTWTDEKVARFFEAIGTRERLAFDIFTYTALRRGDAVKLGRQHVRDGDPLAALIAATTTGDLTFLVTERGQPFVKEGFGDWFREACKMAGCPAGTPSRSLLSTRNTSASANIEHCIFPPDSFNSTRWRGRGVKRRQFIELAGGAAAWPVAGWAQQPPLRLISMLMLNEENDPEGQARVAGFRNNLSSLGWEDGKNARFDVRWYGGNLERAKAFASEIVVRSPDVIVANGTLGVAAVQQVTKSIPIIFLVVTDPLGAGFVRSLSEPEGNVTGFSTFEPEIGGKWIEALLEIAPNTKRVAVLTDPEFSGFGHVLEAINAAAPVFGVRIVPLSGRNAGEIERAFRDLVPQENDSLIVVPTSTNAAHRQTIFALAAVHRLPAIYPFSYYARQGGLLSYGVDAAELFRRAAPYVDRILKGASPRNLPVQGPNKYEIIVNLRTARTIGLAIPVSFLAKADEVIE